MSAEVVPLPARPAGLDLARFGAGQHAVFEGMNLHIGRSDVVHAVVDVPWLGELTVPAPACRQGYAGTGTQGELRPTRWPVTCQRRRRLRGQADDGADQPTLFEL